MRTLKSAAEIDEVFREGKRGSSRLLVAISKETPAGRGLEGRVAFVAGKKTGGAVVRNRAKRVLREAVRRSGDSWPGRDVVLVAKREAAEAAAEDVDRALRAALGRAGVTV